MRCRFFSILLFLFGLLSAAASITAALFFSDKPSVLLEVPESVPTSVESLMDRICAGKFSQAEQFLYGSPVLGLDEPPADEVSRLVWNACLGSTSYEFLGDFYATETGLARDLRITALDVPLVVESLSPLAHDILLSRLEDAEEYSLIYDENNHFRESFVSDVLRTAAQQALESNAPYKESTIALHLVFYGGEWFVYPDTSLLSAISGGIPG